MIVRLDRVSNKIVLRDAAERGISVSDYVRQVATSQARKEIAASAKGLISMTRDEQLAFCKALYAEANLTPAQIVLGNLLRGEEWASPDNDR